MFSVDQSLILVGKVSAATNMSKFTQRSRKGPNDEKERTRHKNRVHARVTTSVHGNFLVHSLVSLVK